VITDIHDRSKSRETEFSIVRDRKSVATVPTGAARRDICK
jgi:hypothetical protein